MADLMLFNYGQLDAEARIVVQQEDKEFDRNMNESGASFLRACHNVRRIQEVLKYKRPGFVDWCDSKPGMSSSTAYKMLNVAQMFPESGNILEASKEVLYLIAAPSTPDEARQEIIEAAERGQAITYSQAKETIDAARPESESWPEPISDDFRKRLNDALHHMTGAAERWERRREVGRTDKELMEAIAYEFGHGGGSSGPDLTKIAFKGGANPRYNYDSYTDDPDAALKGTKLRDLVRELLEIPYPDDAPIKYASVSSLESLIRPQWLAYATGGRDLQEWHEWLLECKAEGKGGQEFDNLMGWMDNDRARYRKGDLWQAVNNVCDQIRWQLAEREKAAVLEATAPARPDIQEVIIAGRPTRVSSYPPEATAPAATYEARPRVAPATPGLFLSTPAFPETCPIGRAEPVNGANCGGCMHYSYTNRGSFQCEAPAWLKEKGVLNGEQIAVPHKTADQPLGYTAEADTDGAAPSSPSDPPSSKRSANWWDENADPRTAELHKIQNRINELMIAADGKKEMGFIGPLAKASLELDKAATFLKKAIQAETA
jgi:hypothetical protein